MGKELTTYDFIKNFNSYKFPKITYYQIQSDKKLSDKVNKGKCNIRDISFASKKSLILYTLKSAVENTSNIIFFDKKENKVLYKRISNAKSNKSKISTEAEWESKRISDYNLDGEEFYYEED